jgi:hypothetical protein
LRDEDLDVVVNGEDHKVPVDDIQDLSLHGDDVVGRVPPLDHVVEGLGTWILDLEVLGRDQEAHQRDEDGVILLVSGHLRGVNVHQVHGVMDGLVVRLQAVSDVGQVIDTFHTFLKLVS